jgi:tetratricopeptide (TPR) repeat protein
VPIDRDAALKEAEQLLRQGKLDGAIEAYVRLVDDRPSDWSSINALGDLCLRTGDVERAITQFTRVADQFFSDGSLQKAAALYKKALRAQNDHEPALQQLGEIAVRQGIKADAEVYLQRLAEQRQRRGDDQGAAASLARLSALKEAQIESRIVAAMAVDSVAAQTTATPPGSKAEGAAADGTVAGDAVSDAVANDVAPLLDFPQAPELSECFDGSTTEDVPERESPDAHRGAERETPVEIEVPLEIEGPSEIDLPPEIEASLEVEPGVALDEIAIAPAETVNAAFDPTPPDHEQAPNGHVREGAGVDIDALEAAARDSRTRFEAATALGRYYIRQGDLRTGIRWLERASAATAARQEEAFAALYELADALESLGESPRALAVLIDLDLDSGGYRDGRARIDRLMAAQTRSNAS